MTRVSIAAEKAGVPAVSIVSTPFMPQARALARGLGAMDPAIAEYPGEPRKDSAEQLHDKTVNQLLPRILEGFRKRSEAPPPSKIIAEPGQRDIVFRGSLHQLHEFFYNQLWTDGLPIIPPTVDAVEKFLEFTDRSPDEIIGICAPEYREATIWNVAVNGVMAGCRPEYMPVLIPIVEALVDPVFRLEDASSTPGWEPLVIINGPIIKELDFNYGTGAMRVGRQANTSIGRFVRLFMRNIPGLRIPPGETDKPSIGYTFNVVLAENEDAVAEMGWEPFSVGRGFERGENVITVQSVTSITQTVYTPATDARKQVDVISEIIGQNLAYQSHTGILNNAWYPLLVMSPSVAKAIADERWSKSDIKQYLYDNTKVRADYLEKHARYTAHADFSFKDLVKRGVAPREYHESDDPARLVRVFVKPEWIGIVVAGAPGRPQTRGYRQSGKQGAPVSRKIRLPQDWTRLLTAGKRPVSSSRTQ